MKELFIIRHAKSSWENNQLTDFERPLNPRGKEDAPIMGIALKKIGFKPDLIVSSSATRAYSTAVLIANQLDYDHSLIEKNNSLYEASTHSVFKIINSLNDKFSRVFLFGHNPTFTMLIEKLGGHAIGNLPTCGVVGIRFELDSWQMIVEGIGSQFFYDFPKNHK